MRSEGSSSGQSARTFTEEARRAQIVECAIDTIADVGYGQASLAGIAKRAGISKGVISYHFAGKDELIERVVEHVYTKSAENMAHRLHDQPTAAATLRVYLTASIEFIRDHPREIAVIGDIVVNHRAPDGSLRYGVHTDEPLIAPLRELFEAGQRSGEFRAFAPEPMARVLRAAIDSTSSQVLTFPDFDADAYARELATTFDVATRKDP
ncbi:TetR/AcrR family transcriptional regulator [Streptomonospora salina]|uniref:AcrR family transcriptional regulator n=1 Tax=Streptomonospora salina TaxID=104205 RepID=A0A841EKY8_9ACTN|nr:TetR/AcrR family transcriptional regulator [Streptomonospora salina]MBB6000990.1 AcrR family transcriptional regulator [Streptomonospora salina]